MARVPADATAFAHRERRIMVNVVAMYDATPRSAPEHEAWVAGLAGELSRGDPGAYAGFLGDEGEERVRAAYPGATWERLAAVKATYDPENVFRLNQNIPPSGQLHPLAPIQEDRGRGAVSPPRSRPARARAAVPASALGASVDRDGDTGVITIVDDVGGGRRHHGRARSGGIDIDQRSRRRPDEHQRRVHGRRSAAP